jgi:hypothetical protein
VIAFVGAIVLILGTLLYLLLTFLYHATCGCFLRNTKTEKSFFKAEVRYFGSLVLMVLFCAVLAAFLILSYTLGYATAFDSITAVADSTYGAANIVYSLSLALKPTFVAMVSTALLPGLVDLNSTGCTAISFDQISNDLVDLNTSIASLPDINELKNAIGDVSDASSAISDDISSIVTGNQEFEDNQVELSNSTDVLWADWITLDASVLSATSPFDDSNSLVDDLSSAYITLFGSAGPGLYYPSDATGLADSVEHDMAITVRNNSAGYGFPVEVTLVDAATGPSASVNRLILQQYNGINHAELQALNVKLHNIYSSFVELPNYTTTAEQLILLNTTLASVLEDIVIPLGDSLAAINDSLVEFPDTEAILLDQNMFFSDLNDFELSTISAHLDDIDTNLDVVTDSVQLIIDDLNMLSDALLSVVPIVYDLLVVQPGNFNRTIYKLPVDTEKIFNTLNETIHDLASTATDFVPTLEDLVNATVDTFDVADYVATLDTSQGLIDDATRGIDQLAMNYSLANASHVLTFDIDTYSAAVAVLKQTLLSALVGMEVVEGYYLLEALRYEAELLLQRTSSEVGDVSSAGAVAAVDGDYLLLAMGQCVGDTTVACEVDADCSASSSVCANIGVYRCTSDGNALSPVVPCTHDADCVGSTYCLADATRAINLRSVLLNFTDNGLIDFDDDSKDSIDAMRESAADLDIAVFSDSLATSVSELVLSDGALYELQLRNLSVFLSASDEYSISSFVNVLSGSLDTIDSLDYSDVEDQLDTVNDKLDTYVKKLGDYITFVDEIAAYIYQPDGLHYRFDQIEEDVVDNKMDTTGFGPTFLYVGQVAQDAAFDVVGIVKNNTFGTMDVAFVKDLEKPSKYLDRATGNPYSVYVDVDEEGSLYYLGQLSASSKLIRYDDAQRGSVTNDVNGNRYEDGKYCLARECFKQTQDELENEPVAGTPLTAHQIMLVALVPLVVVLIRALQVIACTVTPCPKRMRLCSIGRLLCLMIILIPWYLLLSGWLFTLVIFTSDVCVSGPNIASNYIEAMGDDLCYVLGGEGTLDKCRQNKRKFDLEVDIRGMANVFLGKESCASNTENPYYLFFDQLADQFKQVVDDNVEVLLDKKLLKDVREPTKDVIRQFSSNSADVVYDFIVLMGKDVLTCGNVEAIFKSFRDTVCYSALGPSAWFVVTIYLAAWTMCCLGIPAACAVQHHVVWSAIEKKRKKKKDAEEKSHHHGGGEGFLGSDYFHMMRMLNRSTHINPAVLHAVAVAADDEEVGLLTSGGRGGGASGYKGGRGGGGIEMMPKKTTDYEVGGMVVANQILAQHESDMDTSARANGRGMYQPRDSEGEEEEERGGENVQGRNGEGQVLYSSGSNSAVELPVGATGGPTFERFSSAKMVAVANPVIDDGDEEGENAPLMSKTKPTNGTIAPPG